MFKSICLNEKFLISIQIPLKFVPKGQIDNKSMLAQVMAWHQTGDKPLSKLMLTQITDAYIRHCRERWDIRYGCIHVKMHMWNTAWLFSLPLEQNKREPQSSRGKNKNTRNVAPLPVVNFIKQKWHIYIYISFCTNNKNGIYSSYSDNGNFM